MPASEEFFRDQKKLHIVFFVSALAMFAATIWMMADDHLRSWKQHQREFNVVSREKLTDELAQERRRLDQQKLRDLNDRLEKAKANVAEKQGKIAELESALSDKKLALEKQERTLQFRKADQAEAMSSFDLLRGQLAATDPEVDKVRSQRLEREIVRARERIERLDAEILTATAAVQATQADVGVVEKDLADLRSDVEKLEVERTKLLEDVEALQRSIAATDYGFWEAARALPIIDGFASPLKVQQVALDDLPLDYNFKMVTRYDRCMTCHLGIDKAGFTEADGVKQPYCSHPNLDLYVAPKSKHPVDKFGCTICHQGQGTATSFDWASHTPDDSKERERWTKDYGWFFNHFHELPMYPDRFVEASCLKCHHDPYQIPEAKKLLLGYKTIRTNGCFGCHEIDGYKDDGASIGPNLRIAAATDTDQERRRALRKVGPNLFRVSEKLSEDFLWKWIRDPQAFRPSTKMPLFYNQVDEGFFGVGPQGEFDFAREPGEKAVTPASLHGHELKDLAQVEIHAMTAYLLDASKKYLSGEKVEGVPTVSGDGDATRGKELFRTKGCVACHNHKEHPNLEAKGFGPDLSEVAAKFQTPEQKKWLKSWIHNPAFFNPMTYMPNLQLAEAESADLAAYLVSVPGKYARDLAVPEVDPVALRNLALMYESKGKVLTEAKKTIDGMSKDEQLVYLGQKTIARLGCFGCHDIPGFETAKPIGVALTDWGRKDPHKLAFENVVQYVHEKLEQMTPEERAKNFYTKNDYYLWALDHHQREGFLMQKLRQPRSYDEGKIRRWEDRTRMPQFNLSDEERDAVATFVMGLVGETINRKYVYNPSPQRQAEIHGRNLIEKYNCQSCHVFKPGEYKFTPTPENAELLLSVAKKELSEDYSFPGHSAWSVPKDKLNKGDDLVVRGLPDGEENRDEAENPEDPKKYFKLWEATSLKGQVIPSGLNVAIPSSQLTPDRRTDPYGGKYAESLVEFLLSKSAAPQGAGERDKAWQKSPPPLLREGEKVQTPWLYRFLKEPVSIRPSVVLRMPKFNFREGDVEALADYFAASDGAAYPYSYVEIPEREESYLAVRDREFPDYLEHGWKLVTNKELCIKCHPIGGIKPLGKPEELGPPLSRASERLRPEWMLHWIANPKRLVPYTAMPVNFLKDKPQYQEIFKAPSFTQLTSVRDALLNYNRLTDLLLGRQQAQAAPKPPGDDKGGME